MKSLRLVPAALLLCLAVLAFGAKVAGARPTLHPGIEAGWQSSTLLYDVPPDYWDPGWANTFTGGATLDLAIGSGFGVGTGVRYVCYSNHVKQQGFFRQLRVRANYVAIPVLATYAPRPHRGPEVGLGTEIAFLSSARLVAYDMAFPSDTWLYEDVRAMLKATDVSLCATLGWAVPLENHSAIARVRFTRGLSDAAQDYAWATNWKTTGVDLTLGLSW